MEKAKKTAKSAKKNDQAQTDNNSKVSDLIIPNLVFELTISAEQQAAAKQKGLARAQKSIKIDGFRPGRVPLKMVEERLGERGLTELILDEVLPSAYSEHIKHNNLNPLTEPDVTPKSMEPGKDWVFEVSIAVTPEISLGDYQAVAKSAPKSDHHDHEGHNHTEDDFRQMHLQEILKALLEKIKVKVPELLLRKETEHRLGHLAGQLEKVNVPLEEYLKNIGKTREELQQEYAVNTFASLQVELLLAAIIKEAKLTVDDKELENVVKSRVAQRKGEGISRDELNYLHSSLLKQKAIDHLLSL